MFHIDFDKKGKRSIKKLSKDSTIRNIITKQLDYLEEFGPKKAKLLDAKRRLYEIKQKKPSIRIYFYIEHKNITIIEAKMKKSTHTQSKLIQNIRDLNPFANIF